MKIYCGSKGNAAFNKHFRECECQRLPFLGVRNKRLYARVHYDLISCSTRNGTMLNLQGHKAAYIVGLLYFVREGYLLAYQGIGRVVGLMDTLKELAPTLAERLWPILSDHGNRITPEERWAKGWGDDDEHHKALNAWIEATIRPIPGFKEDFRRAIKTKIPLIKLGWEISGESLVKSVKEGG